MATGAAVGAWALVLSLWGEPLSPHLSSLPKALCPLPKSPQNFPGTWIPLFRLPHTPCASFISSISFPAPPPWCCFPGAAVGSRNLTAQIGKPLVLNCKGAPKKPPQQLEWKLVSGSPVIPCPPTSLPHESFPKGLALFRPLSSVPRTQAGQKLGRSCLPREVPGIVWLESSPMAPSSCRPLGSRMRGLSGAEQ